jgi:hypothetical protein
MAHGVHPAVVRCRRWSILGVSVVFCLALSSVSALRGRELVAEPAPERGDFVSRQASPAPPLRLPRLSRADAGDTRPRSRPEPPAFDAGAPISEPDGGKPSEPVPLVANASP